MKIFKKINSAGFSLLELVVSVGLFSIVVVVVSSIFNLVMSSQYEAVTLQDIHENVRYSIEKISKDIRMAQKDNLNSCIPSGSSVYWTNGTNNALQFLNSSGNCVCYYLDGESLMTSEGGCNNGTQDSHNPFVALPEKLKVSNLVFRIIDSSDTKQAFVTLGLRVGTNVKGLGLKEVEIETNISSRFYE